MKRNVFRRSPKRGLFAMPAAAIMLCASQGAQIGINFQTDWAPNNSSFQTSGFVVTGTAFGISAANWFNLAPTSFAGPTSTSQDITTVNGPLTVKWSCANAWGSGIGNTALATDPGVVAPGNDEVTWSYLNDGAPGYFVTISGLRGIASGYTIQTIAAIGDGSAPGFADVSLTTMGSIIQTLDYTNGFYATGGGTVGTSSVSTVYATLSGNDSVNIHGFPKDGNLRSTLAGIILTYTPGSNPPLIEVNPQGPVGPVSPGGSFSLFALASGSPTLHYQWRQGGTDILGANSPSYNKTGAVAADTGGYDVVVTNSHGSATSTVAQVTVPGSNTAPSLAAISNRVILAGTTLTITNNASDAEAPPQLLTYSLVGPPTPPTGASINSTNGIFNWRPAIAQVGSNFFNVQVSDNGTPGQSATQSFWVKVNLPAQPGLANAMLTNGEFKMLVSGDVGPDYTVLSSTNLSNWTPLFSTNPAALPFLFVDPAAGNFDQRFYRVLLGP